MTAPVAPLYIDWYDVPSGGTIVAGNVSSFTPTSFGATPYGGTTYDVYYAETVAANGCKSARMPVYLYENQLPSVTITV